MVFHCLNRSVARLTLFEKPADYEAFERVLVDAQQHVSLRILDYVGGNDVCLRLQDRQLGRVAESSLRLTMLWLPLLGVYLEGVGY